MTSSHHLTTTPTPPHPRPLWSESSQVTNWVVKDLKRLSVVSEDYNQLVQMPGLSKSSLEHMLSCRKCCAHAEAGDVITVIPDVYTCILPQIYHTKYVHLNDTSHNIGKRTFGHVRPAKIQISLRIRTVWSESWLAACWIAKDTKFPHAYNEDSDQSARMRRLICVFDARTSEVHFPMLRLRNLY